MRARQRHQVGATGGKYRIGMVRLINIADRHGREPRFVAQFVAERSLEHSAVDGLRARPGLASGNIDQVGAFASEGLGNLDGIVGGDALLPAQSVAEMRTDMGRSDGHAARIAANTSSG